MALANGIGEIIENNTHFNPDIPHSEKNRLPWMKDSIKILGAETNSNEPAFGGGGGDKGTQNVEIKKDIRNKIKASAEKYSLNPNILWQVYRRETDGTKGNIMKVFPIAKEEAIKKKYIIDDGSTDYETIDGSINIASAILKGYMSEKYKKLIFSGLATSPQQYDVAGKKVVSGGETFIEKVNSYLTAKGGGTITEEELKSFMKKVTDNVGEYEKYFYGLKSYNAGPYSGGAASRSYAVSVMLLSGDF